MTRLLAVVLILSSISLVSAQVQGFGFISLERRVVGVFPVTALTLDVTVIVPPAAIDASWLAR